MTRRKYTNVELTEVEHSQFRDLRNEFEILGHKIDEFHFKILQELAVDPRSPTDLAKDLNAGYMQVYRRVQFLEVLGLLQRHSLRSDKGSIIYETNWNRDRPTFRYRTRFQQKELNLQELGAYLYEENNPIVHAVRYSGALIAALKANNRKLSNYELRACLLGLCGLVEEYLEMMQKLLLKFEVWDIETSQLYLGEFEEDWAELVSYIFEEAFLNKKRLTTKGISIDVIREFNVLLYDLPRLHVSKMKEHYGPEDSD